MSFVCLVGITTSVSSCRHLHTLWFHYLDNGADAISKSNSTSHEEEELAAEVPINDPESIKVRMTTVRLV